MEQYKGEVPSNVVDPAKKQDKPYYKKVGFWVAIGLMVFGIGCSIFGAIQGARYAKAVERAAQTIVDAQSLNASGSQLHKPRNNLATPSGADDHFTFSNHFIGGWTGDAFFRVDTGANVVYNQLPTYVPVWRITISDTRTSANLIFPLSNTSYTTIAPYDYIKDFTTNASASWWTPSLSYAISTSQPLTFSGVFYYYPATQFYDDGYSSGYAEGSADGYEDGYSTGFSDGVSTDDVAQSIHFSSNLSSGYSVAVDLYVDGEYSYTYTMSDGSVGTYSSFTALRSRGQVFRFVIHDAGSDAFNLAFSQDPIVAADGFTALTPQFQYDGAYYMPTNLSDYYFCIVGFTEAPMASSSYDVYFDANEMEHSVTSSYNVGYVNGYDAGNSAGYSSGVAVGSSDGYSNGYMMGFEAGRTDALTNDNVLAGMFVTAFQQPFNQLYRFLNFNLLGVNFLALFTAFITVSVGLIVIKKVL